MFPQNDAYVSHLIKKNVINFLKVVPVPSYEPQFLSNSIYFLNKNNI